MPECNAGEEECELISFDDIETFPAEERRQMLLDDSLLDIYPVDDILLLPDIQVGSYPLISNACSSDRR
jgi:hypothetical protein